MIDIEEALRKENPSALAMDIKLFANALRTYHEATQNILKNGAVVAHPRTGAPIENPYLKVATQTGAVLAKMEYIRSALVIKALDENSLRCTS